MAPTSTVSLWPSDHLTFRFGFGQAGVLVDVQMLPGWLNLSVAEGKCSALNTTWIESGPLDKGRVSSSSCVDGDLRERNPGLAETCDCRP